MEFRNKIALKIFFRMALVAGLFVVIVLFLRSQDFKRFIGIEEKGAADSKSSSNMPGTQTPNIQPSQPQTPPVPAAPAQPQTAAHVSEKSPSEPDIIPSKDSYITEARFEKPCSAPFWDANKTPKTLDDVLAAYREKNGPIKEELAFENFTVAENGEYLIYNIQPAEGARQSEFEVRVFAKPKFDSPATLRETPDGKKFRLMKPKDLDTLIGNLTPIKQERSQYLTSRLGGRAQILEIEGHAKFIESNAISCNGLASNVATCRCP